MKVGGPPSVGSAGLASWPGYALLSSPQKSKKLLLFKRSHALDEFLVEICDGFAVGAKRCVTILRISQYCLNRLAPSLPQCFVISKAR